MQRLIDDPQLHKNVTINEDDKMTLESYNYEVKDKVAITKKPHVYTSVVSKLAK